MKIKVIDQDRSGVMWEFGKAIGARREGRFMKIPKNKGGGYITGMVLGDDLRILIRNYYLKEDVLMERTNIGGSNDYVIFSFSNVFDTYENVDQITAQYQFPAVLIFSPEVSSMLAMPSHTFFRSINIAASHTFLQQLVGHIDHPVVRRILESKEHFAFESTVTPDMIKVAHELITANVPEKLESLFFKSKCEEMICYLFAKLMEREAEPVSKFHMEDIRAIYKIKDHLQTHLDQPPAITMLAKQAGMSEPKLRKLFRQIFGKTVFDFYQSMRIQEAARLLIEERLTVSEAGYRMGFTNLSHFTRVFEAQMGMKPKKYSKADH